MTGVTLRFDIKSVHKVGNFYLDADHEDVYILCCVGVDDNCKSIVELVSLSDGNRWKNGVSVDDIYNVSSDEWKEICGCGSFILLGAEVICGGENND